MGQLNLPNNADANTPSDGKTAVFTNPSGLLATKDAAGNIYEYSPTPLENEGMIYGVRWDSVNDIMQPGIVSDGYFVATDYANFPVQEQVGRYLVTTGGSKSKLNAYGSSIFPDGTSAILDGSSGQVLTWVPRHYQLVITDGDYVYMLISEQPFGFNGVSAWIPPAFLNWSGFWVGAFQAVAASDSSSADVHSVIKDTSGYSMSYPNPFTNQTRGQFRSQCANVGSGFCQWSYGMQEVLRILFITEYKTWNSQAVLPGCTERSYDYSNTSQAGETVHLGDYSGSIYSAAAELYIANSYRGVENPFGNVEQFLDGINIDTDDNQRVWLAFDPDNFADDTSTGYIDSGIAPAFDGESDYQKDIDGTSRYAPLWPVALNDGADSESYMTDYLWSNAAGSGWQVVQSGGTSYNGTQVGFGCFNSTYDSGGDTWPYGSRLAAYI